MAVRPEEEKVQYAVQEPKEDKKKGKKTDSDDDEEEDCDKLGKDADKCRGDRENERRIANEKRDKEWRLKQSQYYREQQE